MTEHADHATTMRLGSPTLGPAVLSLDYRQVGQAPSPDAWQQDMLIRLGRLETLSVAILRRLTRPPWYHRWWNALTFLWRS